MRRRGFLSFLGGAAVAGPGMVKTAAAHGMESLSLGQVAGGLTTGYGLEGPAYATAGMEVSDVSPLDPGHWAQRELADFIGMTAKDLAERRRQTHVSVLDPDLAVMRSLSLSAKIRMQRDRQFERGLEDHRSYLARQVERAIKNWRS